MQFNTTFEMVDRRSSAPRQTTTGLWAALVPPRPRRPLSAPRIVVVDVEGADAAVNADNTSFEQRSGVIIAHMADVIMYHVREGEIGTYYSTGIQLLQSIFQVRCSCGSAT
jgi:hypothetical protein